MEGKAGEEFEAAAIAYVKETLAEHQRIIFNGNGYSDEWPAEAGAPRAWPTTAPPPTRCRASWRPRASTLFEEFGVLTEPEVRSRYEVKLEKYNKLVNIEVAHDEAHGAPRVPARHQRLRRQGGRAISLR